MQSYPLSNPCIESPSLCFGEGLGMGTMQRLPMDGNLISLRCVVVNQICICLDLNTKDYRLKTLCNFGGLLPCIRQSTNCKNAAVAAAERSAEKVSFRWHSGSFPPSPKCRFGGFSRAICQSFQREICKTCNKCESFTAIDQPYPLG